MSIINLAQLWVIRKNRQWQYSWNSIHQIFLPSKNPIESFFLLFIRHAIFKTKLKFHPNKNTPHRTHTPHKKKTKPPRSFFAGTTVGLKYNTYTNCNTGYIILHNNKNINAVLLLAYWFLFSNYVPLRSLYCPWSRGSHHFIISDRCFFSSSVILLLSCCFIASS